MAFLYPGHEGLNASVKMPVRLAPAFAWVQADLRRANLALQGLQRAAPGRAGPGH